MTFKLNMSMFPTDNDKVVVFYDNGTGDGIIVAVPKTMNLEELTKEFDCVAEHRRWLIEQAEEEVNEL